MSYFFSEQTVLWSIIDRQAASTYDAVSSSGAGPARLGATGVLDTSFGTSGRQVLGFDLGAGNNDSAIATVLANGRLVSVGGIQRVFNGGADRDFGILRQIVELSDGLYADGFE